MDVDTSKCNYCGACVGSCPVNCMYLDETRVIIDENACVRCGFCIRVCPMGAISAEWFK